MFMVTWLSVLLRVRVRCSLLYNFQLRLIEIFTPVLEIRDVGSVFTESEINLAILIFNPLKPRVSCE
jgi:hypothetical protein